MHNTVTYIPFFHEAPNSKNALIQLAREQDTSDVKGILTATLIYTNLVDYLARHLLENLRSMISEFSHRVFGAVFFYDGSRARKGMPLGEVCKELTCYGFPDKEDFLNLLKEFNTLRTEAVHGLMQVDYEADEQKFNEKLDKIRKLAEEILNRYNRIVQGVTAIWSAANNPASTSESTKKSNA